QVAREVLGDFKGYLHCDMWSAYRSLDEDEVTLVGCWAHVRRKFFEAMPKNAESNSLAKKGLSYCDQMFALEKQWEELDPEVRHQKRQEQLRP
ncbi:transposase, partial [Streptococcus danieliae]|nr:transposase [Streptococcus danieliae]